ncbi:DUF7668 domain-containing protein [Actinomadura macrotermitis]|uniref:DUF7668 domain-containing protein n=1 Tax=Actinomadura macrotermitis TaxID=2585200 RepID=A0A7K0CA58_9ACTN|nr:hypothetical protein [Actinomadura macrotermitis]MQY09634.1 hypothetical protein [Actinomadura macrotermitis]
MPSQEAAHAVRAVIALLVAGEYEELESLTEGRRLSAHQMREALRGHVLISPPAAALAGLRPAERVPDAGCEHSYLLDVPLWTAREGRSALSVRLVLSEVMEHVWAVEVVAIGDVWHGGAPQAGPA